MKDFKKLKETMAKVSKITGKGKTVVDETTTTTSTTDIVIENESEQ